MIKKRIISFAVSGVMLCSSLGLTAFAEEGGKTDEKKSYDYVALGDSIAAGYGLTEGQGLALDPALVIDLENPINNAYPAVFGEYLKQLAESEGFDSTTANLSATAYRAEDIVKTMQESGYKGEVAEWILERLVSSGSSTPLSAYHEIFDEKIRNAELITIQLGGNDIIMSIVFPIFESKNPILQTAAMTMSFTLIGLDAKSTAGIAMAMLAQNKDKITKENVEEAIQYFKNVLENAEALVDNAAANVKGVIEEIKKINPDADIVVVGMYNPFDASFDVKGKLCEYLGTVNEFLLSVGKAVYGDNFNVNIVPNEEFIEKLREAAAKTGAFIEEIKMAGEALANLKNNINLDVLKEKLEEFKEKLDPENLKEYLAQFMEDPKVQAAIANISEFLSRFKSDPDDQRVAPPNDQLVRDPDQQLVVSRPNLLSVIDREKLAALVDLFSKLRDPEERQLIIEKLKDTEEYKAVMGVIEDMRAYFNSPQYAALLDEIAKIGKASATVRNAIDDAVNSLTLGEVKAFNNALKGVLTAKSPDELKAKLQDVVFSDAIQSFITNLATNEDLKELLSQLPQSVDDLKTDLLVKILTLTPPEVLSKVLDVLSKIDFSGMYEIRDNFSKEMLIPLIAKIAGTSTEPQMIRLNEKLREVAEETGATFVDIYDLPPEQDLDPHPNEDNHKEIAKRLEAAIKDLALAKMAAMGDESKKLVGDLNGDGKITSEDAIIVARYVAGYSNYRTLYDKDVADMDRNGSVTTDDVIIIARYAAGYGNYREQFTNYI